MTLNSLRAPWHWNKGLGNLLRLLCVFNNPAKLPQARKTTSEQFPVGFQDPHHAVSISFKTSKEEKPFPDSSDPLVTAV